METKKSTRKFDQAEIEAINVKLIGLKTEIEKLMKLHGLVEYTVDSLIIEPKSFPEPKVIRFCLVNEKPEFIVNKYGVCTVSCSVG